MRLTAQRLAGMGIWVTRPRHQAQALARLIEAEGGYAVCLPVMDIADVDYPETVTALVARLETFHLAIFVSANAVWRGLGYVGKGYVGKGNWPASVPVAAIGQATARALAGAGVPCAVRAAPPYHSESLLANPALGMETVAGRRVIIFRGVGGRALLEETLRARGALVTSAEVYRRIRPQWPETAPVPWGRIRAVVVTSGEGLENLFALVGEEGRRRLRGMPLVVIGERMAGMARRLGCCEPIVAERASDEAILAALLTMGYVTPTPSNNLELNKSEKRSP